MLSTVQGLAKSRSTALHRFMLTSPVHPATGIWHAYSHHGPSKEHARSAEFGIDFLLKTFRVRENSAIACWCLVDLNIRRA